MTSKKTIMFVTYGGGHVNMLIPILTRLRAKSDVNLIVIGLTTAGKVLQKHGIPSIGFKDILDQQDCKALEWGKRLVGEAFDDGLVSYKESVAYMGLSYMDLEAEFGVQKAADIYAKHGRQAFNQEQTMSRFLKKNNPDLLVTTSSPRAERAAIRMARKLNIKALCLVDLFAFEEVRWLKDNRYADKICVLNSYVKERLVLWGRSEGDIEVTGNPAFDHYIDTSNLNRNQIRESYGYSKTDKVILWASNIESASHPYKKKLGDTKLPEKVESELLDIVRRNVDYRLIIRPHPNDSRVPVVKHDRIMQNSTEDIKRLIYISDCVVVSTSTVGLEASFLDVPLVNITSSIFYEGAPYDKMGISIGVDKLPNLEKAIKVAMTTGVKKAKTSFNIGKATDNLLFVIDELLS